MSHLRLHLIGSPRIECEEAPVALPQRKALALLAYVALNPGPQSREHLATLLWPDAVSSHGLHSLRSALWALKQTPVGRFLSADRQRVELVADPGLWIDVRDLEVCLESSQAHGLKGAMSWDDCVARLIQSAEALSGGFLSGLTTDSLEYDRWQQQTSDALCDRLSVALGNLAEQSLRSRDLAGAIELARSWLALDPWHEPAHRALMEIYASAGNRAAALRQYEACEAVLREEVGLAPSEETVRLRNRIREDELQPSAPDPWIAPSPSSYYSGDQTMGRAPVDPDVRMSPNNLPVPMTSFVGRDQETTSLIERLADPSVRLLTLTGVGGTGKTRLAIRVGWGVLNRYRDGVFFVSLASVRDAAHVLPAIAQALGIGEP